MAVDIGEGRRFLPNYYALRHGGSKAESILRSWNLEGRNSADESWFVLRTHRNDSSLSGHHSVSCWIVDNKFAARRHSGDKSAKVMLMLVMVLVLLLVALLVVLLLVLLLLVLLLLVLLLLVLPLLVLLLALTLSFTRSLGAGL